VHSTEHWAHVNHQILKAALLQGELVAKSYQWSRYPPAGLVHILLVNLGFHKHFDGAKPLGFGAATACHCQPVTSSGFPPPLSSTKFSYLIDRILSPITHTSPRSNFQRTHLLQSKLQPTQQKMDSQINEQSIHDALAERLNATHVEVTDMSGEYLATIWLICYPAMNFPPGAHPAISCQIFLQNATAKKSLLNPC
jgi:hypothetical protein